MDYLIRSVDGRTVVGVRSAEAAAQIAMHLERAGTAVEISDLAGTRYQTADLQQRAEILKQGQAARSIVFH